MNVGLKQYYFTAGRNGDCRWKSLDLIYINRVTTEHTVLDTACVFVCVCALGQSDNDGVFFV